jgi:two-component system cell cycle response regulator DivK
MSTVLIVEDNEKNMKLVRDLLQAKGYATMEAATGQQGVDLALASPPDLVLMDIQLPDINGMEAFSRLRADARTSRVPVLAFTASVTPHDRRRIAEAGFNGFIAKPMEIKSFLALVKQVLGEGAA